MCTGFFVAAKFDDCGTGVQAHNAGVFMSSVGTIGFIARTIAGSGSPRFNMAAMLTMWMQGYYDWGMAHMWTAYLAYYKQEMSGRSQAFTTSLWVEYVPQHVDPVFLHYRPLHVHGPAGISQPAEGNPGS